MLMRAKSSRNRRLSAPVSPRFIGDPVTISNDPTVDVISTLSAFSAFGSPTISYTYQWRRDGVAIALNATSATYTSVSADSGTSQDCAVTATSNAAGTTPVTVYTPAKTVIASGGTGTMQLTWEAPLFDGDGQPLTDLNGFKVYYGTVTPVTAANSTGNSGTLSSATFTYTIESLTANTWYATVVAIDVAGNESYSGIDVSKVIAS
jgi:hypothetical protein